MGFLVPLLASVVLLFGTGAMLSTLGRRRRRTHARALPPGARAALEGAVGAGLTRLVVEALGLRQRLEDIAASGREMLTVEAHLGTSAGTHTRRPLWRQLEDANFGHELEGGRRETLIWLAHFDALGAGERPIVEHLDLDPDPLRVLVARMDDHEFPGAGAGLDALREHGGWDLRTLQAELDAAIACLRRFEVEISSYRGGGYR